MSEQEWLPTKPGSEFYPTAAHAEVCTEVWLAVLMAAPKVGIPWTKNDAIREARRAAVQGPW